MIDPHGASEDVIEDVPEMSVEEVEKRIGSRERTRRRRTTATRRVEATPVIAQTRRVVLWRDSATILAGVILALLAARFLLPGDQSSATGSPTPGSSAVVVLPPTGTATVVVTLGPTFGGVVNPSLHLDATPSPIPVITLPPRTPKPSPTKPPTTPAPGVSTPPKTAPPPPTAPPPTAPPPPVAVISSCNVVHVAGVGYPVTCDGSQSLYETSYSWSFQSCGTDSGNPGNCTYPDGTSGTFTVTLTVTNSTSNNTDQWTNLVIPGP